MSIELLDIIMPALCVGIAVLLTHIILGRYVLARGIIFIDLAIAQIAAMGALMAEIYLHDLNIPLIQLLIPVTFACTGAAIIALIERFESTALEAYIGLIYVFSAALCALIIANSHHGDELSKNLLSGQILWSTWSDVASLLALSIVVLTGMLLLKKWLNRGLFYFFFAISITASVKVIGIYLVFTSLIVPALATRSLSGAKQYFTALFIGIIGYSLGLYLSMSLDVPAGPIIVCMLVIIAAPVRIVLKNTYK